MTPDSSKDLEKDEREAMESYIKRHGSGTHYMFVNGVEAGWKERAEARLQQVEAERDGLMRTGEETERYLGGKLQAAEDRDCRLADELSIAREALEDATEGLKEMIAYVPEYFQEKWEHPGYVERAQAALARLQAKEEGT